MITRPMLAGKGPTDFEDLTYPLIATPKLDGIRCLIINGEPVSRKFLPIPNEFIRKTLKKLKLPNNLDGELMVNGTFQDVASGIMSHDGEPDFTYYVFDYVSKSLDEPYGHRVDKLEDVCDKVCHRRLRFVPTHNILNANELEAYEESTVAQGHEGVMVRRHDGPYKLGRSTTKEGWLLKIKRFEDAEARVIAFEEAETNTNKATKDNTGATKRSQAKAGKVGKGTLGALIVRILNGEFAGRELRIGTGIGFNDELKQRIWDDQGVYLDRTVKFKYQPTGSKDLPRIPSFQGFRDD